MSYVSRDDFSLVVDVTKGALGFGTPEEQMYYSAILGVIAYVSGAVGLVVTILAGVFFTITFLIGLVRYANQELRGGA